MEALDDFNAEPPDGGWAGSEFQWDPYRLEVALAAQDTTMDGENRTDRSYGVTCSIPPTSFRR